MNSSAAENLPYICVDKSFANRRHARMADLASNWRILVPSAFYYEVFTTEFNNRVRELKHFPPFNRVHLPILLYEERKTGKASVLEFDEILTRNSTVLSKEWRLSTADQEIMDQYDRNSLQPSIAFWNEVLSLGRGDSLPSDPIVPGIDNEAILAMRRSDEEFVKLAMTLQNPDVVRKIAGGMGSPHYAKLDESWLEFRRIQSWALHAIVLLKKHPPRTELPNATDFEHDIQDLEYLMLGLHCGALASHETNSSPCKARMVWRFRILHPDGCCITS